MKTFLYPLNLLDRLCLLLNTNYDLFLKLEDHKQQIEAIMWDHHEKYREAKIELETLTQELQKELEQLKSTCIINTEKIGYNYQVLIFKI